MDAVALETPKIGRKDADLVAFASVRANEVYNAVVKEDLSFVEEYMADKMNYDLANARMITRAYKQFFSLQVSGVKASPNKPIDDFWHAFILHTRQYQDFCAKFADRFVHHQPFSSKSSAPKGTVHFIKVHRVARKIFGDLDASVWEGKIRPKPLELNPHGIHCCDNSCR